MLLRDRHSRGRRPTAAAPAAAPKVAASPTQAALRRFGGHEQPRGGGRRSPSAPAGPSADSGERGSTADHRHPASTTRWGAGARAIARLRRPYGRARTICTDSRLRGARRCETRAPSSSAPPSPPTSSRRCRRTLRRRRRRALCAVAEEEQPNPTVATPTTERPRSSQRASRMRSCDVTSVYAVGRLHELYRVCRAPTPLAAISGAARKVPAVAHGSDRSPCPTRDPRLKSRHGAMLEHVA